jgi:hypothetical protein
MYQVAALQLQKVSENRMYIYSSSLMLNRRKCKLCFFKMRRQADTVKAAPAAHPLACLPQRSHGLSKPPTAAAAPDTRDDDLPCLCCCCCCCCLLSSTAVGSSGNRRELRRRGRMRHDAANSGTVEGLEGAADGYGVIGQAHPETGHRMASSGVLRGGAAAVDEAQPGMHEADASVVQREAAAAAAPTTWGPKNLPES